MAISAYNSYYKLNKYIEVMIQKWTFNSSKSNVLQIVLAFGVIGYHIQSFVVQILLLFRGSKIINLMKTQNLEYIEEKIERRIGIFLALSQFLISITLEILIEICIPGINISPKDEIKIKAFLFNFILYVIIFSSRLSIITLIAYQSLIVSQQLENISKKFSQTSIQNIYRFIGKMNTFTQDLDQLFSPFISISLFSSLFNSIAYASLLGIDPKNFLIVSLAFISESLIILVALCLSCDIIPKSLKKFCNELEKNVSENTNEFYNLYQINQNILLMKINTIKHEIGFTASDLFKINTNTIISILALILSYSVILIQTSNEN
jgi:hypothetical protein